MLQLYPGDDIISNNGNYAEGLDDVVSLIKERIIRAKKEDSISLNKLFKAIDSGFSIEPGSSLSIFIGMLLSKEIGLDMDKKIDLTRTPNEILLTVDEGDVVDG